VIAVPALRSALPELRAAGATRPAAVTFFTVLRLDVPAIMAVVVVVVNVPMGRWIFFGIRVIRPHPAQLRASCTVLPAAGSVHAMLGLDLAGVIAVIVVVVNVAMGGRILLVGRMERECEAQFQAARASWAFSYAFLAVLNPDVTSIMTVVPVVINAAVRRRILLADCVVRRYSAHGLSLLRIAADRRAARRRMLSRA